MKISQEMMENIQKHFGFNDDDLQIFVNDPRNQEILSRALIMQDMTFIIKVVESKSCNSGHNVGDKFYFDAAGNLLTKLCPKKICIFALSQADKVIFAASELIYAGLDPNEMRFKRFNCFDVGLHCGGWGNCKMEFKAQKRKK